MKRLVFVAVFVLIGVVISCNKSGSAEEAARSTGTVEVNRFTGDTALNGIWRKEGNWNYDRSFDEVNFDNGNLTRSIPPINFSESGTYTTNDGVIDLTINRLNWSYNIFFPIPAKWYTRDEFKSALETIGFPSDEADIFANQLFFRKITYSINEDVLSTTSESEGPSGVYIKQ